MSNFAAEDAPSVRLVEELITKAIACAASDIHCEPTDKELRIRYRIDGVLVEQTSIPAEIALQVISRIKVLANVDVAERRIPQDGKFSVQKKTGVKNSTIDLRVATFPTPYGEKIVVRILDHSHTLLDLDHIGLSLSMLNSIKKLLNQSNGFFLVTGPTGSGKTTTLYAALHAIKNNEKNIVTLEDPIEYSIDGITQGSINTEIGFTFGRGIRALLRQDPDIIMVGEIRDTETAQVAIQAALTGHLVLSTLHTNNAPGAIMRLLDMGIEHFLINAAVTGVLAQRLARKLCVNCRKEVPITDAQKSLITNYNLAITKLFESPGCASCNNLGFKGRTGIFELLLLNENLRSLISREPRFDELCAEAYKNGYRPLIHDGAEKVNAGIISLSELLRVAL